MPNGELKIRTTKLLNQISEIKNEHITAYIFNSFVNHLKTEANSLTELTNTQEIQNQLNELKNFKSFDELTLIERFFVRLLVFRFQFNWVGNWKNVGKYWNDLHNIELKLRGIQHKLPREQQ
ncbi:MAG: hypothetical protein HRT61_15910 [Ekhidna sp.]|nr:hypothetical protein [Ekhidna sp.]